MFKALFGRKLAKNDPHLLYGVVVARARAAEFYSEAGVPDTIDGRFEMLTMHMYLVLRRLKQDENDHSGFSQALFDTFIDDIAAGLREAGVGDQTVPKRLQKMSRVFYGRVKAWDAYFESDAPTENLNKNLSKNLYPSERSRKNMDLLANYFQKEDGRLKTMKIAELKAGKDIFQGKILTGKEAPND